jgi:urease accessory protein
MDGEHSSPWLLWQLADSAFPTGGFAHSGGLEAAWQLGEVRGREGLEHHLADSLDQCGHAALPFVGAARREPARFTHWDRWYDATVPNHVANRASRALGQGLLTSAVATFGRETLTELKALVRRERLPTHLPVVTGAMCAAIGVALGESQRLFLFLHLRALVSTAIRLGIIGPLEAQAVQHRLAPVADAVLGRCADLVPEQAAATVPLHDLFQGHHDRLYSRLFMT